MNWSDFLITIGIFFGVAAYFNEDHLRKRLNRLEDTLTEKGIITNQDIVDKICEEKIGKKLSNYQ